MAAELGSSSLAREVLGKRNPDRAGRIDYEAVLGRQSRLAVSQQCLFARNILDGEGEAEPIIVPSDACVPEPVRWQRISVEIQVRRLMLQVARNLETPTLSNIPRIAGGEGRRPSWDHCESLASRDANRWY